MAKTVKLDSRMIREAYALGYFPMCDNSGNIDWYTSTRRAIFPYDGFHLSRSMRKLLKRCPFRISFDEAFEDVIRGCLRPGENWICEEIIRAYTVIHLEGWAHSCEVWLDSNLVGGVYGLAIGTCFCAESMFHRVTNASKVALYALIQKCEILGFTLFDAQVMNPHLASLGAVEISALEYEIMLEKALQNSTPWSLSLPLN